MAVNGGIKMDSREWSSTSKQYLAHSSRDLPELVNQGAFNINTTAVAITKRASKAQIKADWMRQSDIADAPFAAVYINSDLGLRHKLIRGWRGSSGKGLYGKEMREAIKDWIRQQQDSINFLRAGWLSAVATLARAIRKQPGKNAARFLARFGVHGGATPAMQGLKPTATFWNEAFSRWTSTENGLKFAREGMEKAIAQDVSRMKRRIEQKLQQTANRYCQKFLKF